MSVKVISADYLRHNLKDIVQSVLNGEEVILKYGSLPEIKLSPVKTIPKSKAKLLVSKLKTRIVNAKSKKPSYKSNQELYSDLSSEFLKN